MTLLSSRQAIGKVLLLASALIFAISSTQATTYYVANSGSDTTNAGTSPSSPWQTIAKVNTVMASLQAGDSVLLNRGDVFRDDYLRCLNEVKATTSTTTTTNPPACSGSASAQVTIGAYGSGSKPIIDGADILSLTWTLVQGTTWQATYTGAMPTKLYVDSATRERQQLIPVPNYVGAYASGTTYNFLDEVAVSTNYLIHGGALATTDTSTPADGTNVWTSQTNSGNSTNASQNFPTTNTGLQNVEAGVPAITTFQSGYGFPTFPGAWYVTGSTIYINLADGSNPNNHVISGTRRPYGILLSSVSYVTVQDIAIEHTQKSGLEDVTYSNTGRYSDQSTVSTYWTNEYNVFQRLHIWNYGDTVVDQYPMQGHFAHGEAGIMVSADGQYFPHLLRGIKIFNNKIGIVGSYFGMYGSATSYQAGIFATGIDGGGSANNLVIAGNYVSTVNGKGIIYSNQGLSGTLSATYPTLNNSGGRVSNNELTNNQGNIFFTSVDGGLADGNYIHESYGEGFQLGSSSTSAQGTSTIPTLGSQVISFNRIIHVWKSASQSNYNGIDCNSNTPGTDGVYELNNTVVDTWGALLTFENLATNASANPTYGCTRFHVHNNILSQNHLAFPAYTGSNTSNLLYYVGAQYAYGGMDFSKNFYTISSGQTTLAHSGTGGTSFSASTFLAGFPDTDSVIGTDEGFTNFSALDLSLRSNSPAVGTGVSGVDLGAIPYVATPLPPLRSVAVRGRTR